MDSRREGNGSAQEKEGSSQVDVLQRQTRPKAAPRCGVCQTELDELKAMKSEAQDDLIYFCDLQCFGEWEHARAGR